MSIVNRYATASPCSGDAVGTCLELLAEAPSILGVEGLCPGCTQRLMTAVEWITGKELAWSGEWLQRAEMEAQP